MQASEKQPNPEKCDKNLFKRQLEFLFSVLLQNFFLESLSATADK